MTSVCFTPSVASVIQARRAPAFLPCRSSAGLRGQAVPAVRWCRLAGATCAAANQQPAQQHDSAPSHPAATFAARVCNPQLLRCMALCAGAAVLAAAMPSAAQAAADAAAGSGGGIAAMAKGALSFILHLDVHLGEIIAQYGQTTYAILFAIVFAETGLVVTPFLPGDSLLFATGALAALGKLSLPLLLGCYIVAATLGDAVNYAVGSALGTAAFRSSLIKREYVQKTEAFYDKYGGKTVVLARFVPIVRTFAPFVAGVGSMSYGKFALYNVAGAVLWTVVCVGAGYAFGNVPAVHENFSLVVLGIVAVSLLPIAWELWAAKREVAAAKAVAPAGTSFADPLEEKRVKEVCEEDPSAEECRVYDD